MSINSITYPLVCLYYWCIILYQQTGYIGVTSIVGGTQYGYVVGEYVGILVAVIQECEVVIIERKKGSYHTGLIGSYYTKGIRRLSKVNMKELFKR